MAEEIGRRTFLVGLGAALCASRLDAAADAVDEAGFVTLNGVEQWVALHGSSRTNLILLILGGGPGVPVSYLAPALADWQRYFTLALWDQPGSGATFMKNGGVAGTGPVTVDRFAADGIALVEHLRGRLGQRKIVLLGYSWGSMVGLTMIARRPELFSAYLGTGQAVDVRRADQLSYALVLAAARERGDEKAVAALEKIGPPPFTFEERLVKQQYATAPTEAERPRIAEFAKLMAAAPKTGPSAWPASLGSYNAPSAFLGTQRASFADAQAWSAAPLGNRFRVPIILAQGEQDLNTVTSLVQEFAARIRAPRKKLVLIPGAGHGTFPYFRDELLAMLHSEVLPLARR